MKNSIIYGVSILMLFLLEVWYSGFKLATDIEWLIFVSVTLGFYYTIMTMERKK